MKFRFEQKVIYRDLDPFVIISLWVFAVSLQFSYAIKWDHNICHGGGGGAGKGCRGGDAPGSVVYWRKKHIYHFLDPSRLKEIFEWLLNFGFYGICRPELEGFICFWASLFNIHKYLLNRPKWFHIERWYRNKRAGSERPFLTRQNEIMGLPN